MLIRKVLNAFDVQEWEKPLIDLMGSTTSAGEIVNAENAFGSLGVVFACVDRRARALSKLPLQVYMKNGDSRSRTDDHELSYLLEVRPNKWQTPSQMKAFIETSMCLWGNAYYRVNCDRRGRITALEPLNPSKTNIVFYKGEYVFQTQIDGKINTLRETEVIHIPYLSIDGKRGKAPLTVARESAGNLMAMQKHEGGVYKNGALTRGAVKVPSEISRDAKIKFKNEWRDLYGGVSNAGDIAILDSGLEWQNISMPLKDAEFVLSKKLNMLDVANIFNVPSFLLNDMEGAKFNNAEQQNMRMFMDVIQPDCIQIEEELNYKCFVGEAAKTHYTKFNLNAALRGDSKSRAEYYKEMVGMGAYSINEVRRHEDADPVIGGDGHRVDLNHISLEIADEYQMTKAKGGEKTNETA